MKNRVKHKNPPYLEKYTGLDNYRKPRLQYCLKVWLMTDQQLFDETKSKIWLSGYANNNPRSDYHWHVDAIYDEWERRGKIKEYSRAFEEVTKGL